MDGNNWSNWISWMVTHACNLPAAWARLTAEFFNWTLYLAAYFKVTFENHVVKPILCSLLHCRKWVLWATSILWNQHKSSDLFDKNAASGKCHCCKECYYLVRHLLSHTSFGGNFGWCILGTILDHCSILNNLLHGMLKLCRCPESISQLQSPNADFF